jgi:hypothetical protein
VVIFLFSVLTPEFPCVQGYSGETIPAFFESDADCALCGNFVFVGTYNPSVQLLRMLVQVHHFAPVIASTSLFYRGPPFCGA